MKYKKGQKVHFVGIGGAGVSSLATILHEIGVQVSGCDQTESPFTSKLISDGIDLEIGHNKKHVENKDLIIKTSAIPETNQEIIEAAKQEINIQTYPQALGELTAELKTIAICGTHGKTTTTAFTYFAMRNNNDKPALVVGSTIPQLDNINGTIGDGKTLILEACEYQRHFLEYKPTTILINNIDLDHLDYFKNQEDYSSAYLEFAKKLPANGKLIVNGDDQNVAKLISLLNKKMPELIITTFGFGHQNDFRLENGTIYRANKPIGKLDIQLPGKHNLLNALGAFVVATMNGTDTKTALEGISQFKGTGRRMELLGEYNGALIYDDYAHHPSEIKATLSALREKYGEKANILCVFQPHQHSRTQLLKHQFAKSFTDATELIIADIYEARDSQGQQNTITAQTLSIETSKNHPSVKYGGSKDQIIQLLRNDKIKRQIIITLGAGDIWQLSHQLVKQ